MISSDSKLVIGRGNNQNRMSRGKCKSCIACKGNPRLRERYYRAWFGRAPGEETLDMIGQDIGISKGAIYRHAHNHMKRKLQDMTSIEKRKVESETLKTQAMKTLEVSFDHGAVVPKEDYEMAVDQVIVDGIAQMKVGDKDITINQVLAAAKLKGEWKLKKRGQDTELIKMMYRSASGFTPTPAVTGQPASLGSPGTN